MSILNFLKDIIFPKQCITCKTWGSFLCQSCSLQVSIIKHQRCIACQKPSMLGLTHPKCQTKYLPERLITVFKYQQPIIQQTINTAKLTMVPEMFSELSRLAISKLEPSYTLLNNFVVCPIPLSIYKHKFRGFNQSQIIAKEFSQTFQLSIDNLLTKNSFIKQQKKLDKIARQNNMQNAFRLTNNQGLPKHVLLIDDVTTTGATFKAASKVLKQASIKTVWCIALAQD